MWPARRIGRRRGHHRGAVALDAGVAPAANAATSAWYVLVNCTSGKAVEVTGRSAAAGAGVVQYGDWNGFTQQWQPVRIGQAARQARPPHPARATHPADQIPRSRRDQTRERGSGPPCTAYRAPCSPDTEGESP
jgi:hypothetical protein